MGATRIVVRYLDGRVLKGYTSNFFPDRDLFHLTILTGEIRPIDLIEIKAVFFVKTFEGNPHYDERKSFVNGTAIAGRKTEVRFADGETMIGTTMGYDAARKGFFLHPADPESNNERVFVVSAAVTALSFP